MSLATRCTACRTVFRVVQDQLRVSEGWVRCGRCNEVFNALEGLFDLERDTPPEGSTGTPSQAATALAQEVEDTGRFEIDAPEAATAAAEEPSLVDRIDAELLGSRHSEDRSTAATGVIERDRPDFPDAQFDPGLPTDDAALADAGATPELPADAALEPSVPTPAPAPEFMRHAQRQALWHSPTTRAALVAASIVLLAALALQGVHHFRDLIAARWPAAKPALGAWCGAMSCAIEAPRRIDDVSVESTALTRAATPDAFKLSVSLRNRGSVTVALPSVDLSLTDPTGQLVARRVLAARDFHAASTTMQPGAELALQVALTVGSARVTGYTVEIFYP